MEDLKYDASISDVNCLKNGASLARMIQHIDKPIFIEIFFFTSLSSVVASFFLMRLC